MGSDDEKVLSQADVDALVALIPSQSRASGGSNQTAVEEPVLSNQPETVTVDIASGEVSVPAGVTLQEFERLQREVADLTKQVTELLNATRKIAHLEEKIEQIAKAQSQFPGDSHNTEMQINEIRSQVMIINQNLKNRHELREDFQCSHCKSKATVAFYAKCTSCGKEKWFGWWPSKKPVHG